MTWQIKDTLPHRSREGIAPPGMPPPSAQTWNDAAPLPTVAAAMAWDKDSGTQDLTRAEEEALLAQGIVPEREWEGWRHLMTRGMVAL